MELLLLLLLLFLLFTDSLEEDTGLLFLLSSGKTKSKSDGTRGVFGGGSTSPSNGFVLGLGVTLVEGGVVGTGLGGGSEEEKMSRISLVGDLFLGTEVLEVRVGGSVFSVVSGWRGVMGFSAEAGLGEKDEVSVKAGRGVTVGVDTGLKGMMKEGARLRVGVLRSSCASLLGCGELVMLLEFVDFFFFLYFKHTLATERGFDQNCIYWYSHRKRNGKER